MYIYNITINVYIYIHILLLLYYKTYLTVSYVRVVKRFHLHTKGLYTYVDHYCYYFFHTFVCINLYAYKYQLLPYIPSICISSSM